MLDAYLNSVYLGSGAYGVEAAAKEYFNEDASQLDLAQAALLAGLIQAPSAYDPIENPEGARQRRSEVLARMVYYKSISPGPGRRRQRGGPADHGPRRARACPTPRSAYYVDEVVNQLLNNPALGDHAERAGERPVQRRASRYIRTKCRRCSLTRST